WGGDRAFVFEREGHAPLFVWATAWDSVEDAQEFFRAYNALERRRGAGDAGNSSATEAHWREGGLLTYVRVEGDGVLVVRGAGTDAPDALDLALKR
ncbi:MAG: hypothetical protein WCD76_11115, partial [Pyrinomonadaceae bacterium]